MHPSTHKSESDVMKESPWSARYVCACGWQSPFVVCFPTKEAAIKAAAKKAVIIEQN